MCIHTCKSKLVGIGRIGSKAITGKAVWSANSPARLADANTVEHKKEVAEEDARDFARMAKWDAAKITIGGVEMTNAEAQEARQYILLHREEYIRRAISRGDMTETEADAVMRGLQREHEWADKERNGTLTDEDRAARKEWHESRECALADQMTASRVVEHREEVKGPIVKADSLFPSAPDVGSEFSRAHAGTVPAPTQAPATPPPELKRTGFDL